MTRDGQVRSGRSIGGKAGYRDAWVMPVMGCSCRCFLVEVEVARQRVAVPSV